MTSESEVRPMRRSWRLLADSSEAFADSLCAEAVICGRNPSRLSNQEYCSSFADRLNRCNALGQHLQHVLPGRERDDQFGCYGTAAGLELMATSAAARRLAADGAHTSTNGDRPWARSFLATWNFLDLVLENLSDKPESKFWEQTRTLLRLCHVLRAICACSPVLVRFGDEATAGQFEAPAYDDVKQRVHTAYTHGLARKVFAQIASLKFLVSADETCFRATTDNGESSFRFAVDASESAENCTEWVFVWSSVISATCRAFRAGIIPAASASAVVGPTDIRHLMSVLEDRQALSDDRYRAFGLWALSQLPTPSDGKPLAFGMDSGSKKWLVTEARNTCRRLLAGATSLVDVHSPYQVYFSQRTVGEKYHDDYFVVPVMPVVVDLIARYRPMWLFRPTLRSVLNEWIRCTTTRDESGSVRTLPFQVGTANGTVNSLYYVEAARAAAARIREFVRVAPLLNAIGHLRDRWQLILGIGAGAGVVMLLRVGNLGTNWVNLGLGVLGSIIAALVVTFVSRMLGRRN